MTAIPIEMGQKASFSGSLVPDWQLKECIIAKESLSACEEKYITTSCPEPALKELSNVQDRLFWGLGGLLIGFLLASSAH